MGGQKELEYIRHLMRDTVIPPLEGELADNPLLVQIRDELQAIREVLYSFSAGDFSPTIKVRGIIPGCLKALQAHLRHLIWQVQLVEQGDFSQEVRFMGEFSSAFNSMVRQMNMTLTALKQKEEALTSLTHDLRSEVNRRGSAVEALQESENHFKYLASHDPLTGCLNRVSFIEQGVKRLREAALEGYCCCMVMLDIDFFKRYNDTYGHLAGDETLRHVVKCVSAALRKHDFMGRYGGEEFSVFFFQADAAAGMAIAERLRAALENTPVQLENGPVTVRASFGVVEAKPEASIDVQCLINCADTALYAAKRAGRNRVELYQSGQAERINGTGTVPLGASDEVTS